MHETIQVQLSCILDLLRDAGVAPSENIVRFAELSQTSRNPSSANVISEIYDKFFHTNKVQLQQFIYNMQEQVRSLETTNKNLNLKLQRSKLDMKSRAEGRPAAESMAWERRKSLTNEFLDKPADVGDVPIAKTAAPSHRGHELEDMGLEGVGTPVIEATSDQALPDENE